MLYVVSYLNTVRTVKYISNLYPVLKNSQNALIHVEISKNHITTVNKK